MNPALKANKNGAENKMAPPKAVGRDRAINQTVIIKKGGYKGLLGIVKDTTDTHARVELHTKGKTVTVPKEHLSYKDKVTGAKIELDRGGPRIGQRSSGGRPGVPDWQGGNRSPISSAPERTPAWGGVGSRSKFTDRLSNDVMLTRPSPGVRWQPHSGVEVWPGHLWVQNSSMGGWVADRQPLRW
jgi:transcription elongation factor